MGRKQTHTHSLEHKQCYNNIVIGKEKCIYILQQVRRDILGQQYNVEEKPTVIVYIYYIIALQGHKTKNKNKTETM